MSTNSSIEWTDATWNPVVGCTPVSPGCLNCYAATMAGRLEAMGRPEYVGLTVKKKSAERKSRRVFSGVVRELPERLEQPLGWREPRRIFVNSMSDLFHESVSFEFIDRVFAVMALCPQHTFQILTKRPERMAEYLLTGGKIGEHYNERETHVGLEILDMACAAKYADHESTIGRGILLHKDGEPVKWPLPNVWLGTSVEDQPTADERVPHLRRCPAVVRFISYEPALGPVDFGKWLAESDNEIDLIIVGAESGPGARPFKIDWARSIIRQCKAAGPGRMACFVKQLGAHLLIPNDSFDKWPRGGDDLIYDAEGPGWSYQGEDVRVRLRDKKGGDMAEWPEELRVRELPQGALA